MTTTIPVRRVEPAPLDELRCGAVAAGLPPDESDPFGGTWTDEPGYIPSGDPATDRLLAAGPLFPTLNDPGGRLTTPNYGYVGDRPFYGSFRVAQDEQAAAPAEDEPPGADDGWVRCSAPDCGRPTRPIRRTNGDHRCAHCRTVDESEPVSSAAQDSEDCE